MTNITKEVEKFLDNNPCIRRNLNINLINTRALAKMIIKEKKLDASLDAVTSAIRRYKIDDHIPIFVTASKIISESTLRSIKSALVHISLIKEGEIQKLLQELFSILQYDQDATLKVIQSGKSIKIIVDEKNLGQVKTLLLENKSIKIKKNLASITLDMHTEIQRTPGIIALIATELAINNISVVEITGSGTEITWLVEEKDILETHNIFNKLCKH